MWLWSAASLQCGGMRDEYVGCWVWFFDVEALSVVFWEDIGAGGCRGERRTVELLGGRWEVMHGAR